MEVRSPDDRRSKIARKTELYLEHGALAVLDVDPAALVVRVTTPGGTVTLGRGQAFSHPALPGLALEVDALFAPRARRKR
ncbi:MAG: Uma2 family endonuclease [Candidatus Eremiobacteraeota bacterium]|nr:Uma2 family endonuclease [Candidatus Eremiobacteraeota bacterium]